MHLSDTQLIILSAAAGRDNRIALPLPDHLKGGVAQKVVASLINKGLLAEIDAMPGQQTWSRTADGDGRTLIITDAGLVAIGIEPETVVVETPASEMPQQPEASQPATGADTGASASGADHAANAADTAPTAAADAKLRAPREGTKQAQLIAMLRAPDGATIEEIAAALEWAAHTVRGAMTGALKKKLGLTVTSEKVEGRGRVYTIH